jgi:hypothetical protein
MQNEKEDRGIVCFLCEKGWNQ